MGESASVSCNFAASRQSSEPTSPLPSLGTMDAANNIETGTDDDREALPWRKSHKFYNQRFLPLVRHYYQSSDASEAAWSIGPPPPSSLPSLGTMDAANNIETGENLPIEIDFLTGLLSEKIIDFRKTSRELDGPLLGRIPDDIRVNHSKEYAPHIIFIGPFGWHYYCSQKMKLQFLSDLCSRVARNRSMTEENVLRNITTAVQMRGVEVKKKYSQPLNRKMSSSEGIVEMLVLDGCFIVELLLKWNDSQNELLQALPTIFKGNILNLIKRDLLLYENQIPFFILEDIHGTCFPTNVTDMSNSQSIGSLAIKFFGYKEELRLQDIHHLLHLCHKNMVGEQNPRADNDEGNDPANCTTIFYNFIKTSFYNFIKTIFNYLVVFMIFILLSPALLLFGFLLLIWSWWKYCWNTKKYVAPMGTRSIPTVTQLVKYGVQFRTKQIVGNASFTDVSFKDGIIEIPYMRIEDQTSSMYRNILALEQSCKVVYGNKFTSYVVFMDDLIDTADDVALLRKKKILRNCLGSEEEVAKLFNEMCVGLALDLEHHVLVDMYGEINKYCDGTYNKWRATLMRDYFNSPWSIISVLAVSFVIFLAVVQTVCSIIQVKTGK